MKLAACAVAIALLAGLVHLGWLLLPTGEHPSRVIAAAATRPIDVLIDFALFYCLLRAMGRLR